MAAEALHSLGHTHRGLGEKGRARDCFVRALRTFREIGFAPGIERVEADLAGGGVE